ncbi:MAG: exodeoxyribonuclease V subunit alpha [Leptospirales bacterium]|nr:exodeoxyribonuclease V subunit alpha [Leptospirales bacterium]
MKPEALADQMASLCARLHQESVGDAEGAAFLMEICAELGRAMDQGNVCLPMDHARQLRLSMLAASAAWAEAPALAELQNEPLPAPLLYYRQMLYFRRHFLQERSVAQALAQRLQQATAPHIAVLPPEHAGGIQLSSEQNAAVQRSLSSPILAVSGGPGAGKTRTAAAILAARKQRQPQARCALLAPTGKAAARLNESLVPFVAVAPASSPIAQTVHRFLGARPDGSFHYNEQRKAPIELCLIDEASMLDLEMLAALLRALPSSTALAFFGDRDQLASVEAGAAFAELCRAPAMQGAVALLSQNFRFSDQSQIAQLSSLVRQGQRQQCQALLQRCLDLPEMFDDLLCAGSDSSELRRWIVDGYGPALKATSPDEALQTLDQFRLLAVTRSGPAGVDNLNRFALESLRQAGYAQALPSPAFSGCPILILENSYELGLFNGDSGVLFADSQGRIRGWFRRGTELKSLPLHMLPRFEAAFAITVHKSQGSEYETVLIVAPDRPDLPLFTRELFYTGLTRASRRAILFGPISTFVQSVDRQTERASGLASMLADLLADGPAVTAQASKVGPGKANKKARKSRSSGGPP